MFFNEDDTLDKLDTFQKENEMLNKMKDNKNKKRLQAIQKQHSTENTFIPKPKIKKVESAQPTNIKPPKTNKLSDEELLRKIEDRKRNSNNSKAHTTTNINTPKNTKSYFMYAIPIIVIFIGLIVFNLNNSNPLIGKWKPVKKTIFATGNIEFTKDRAFMMGITSKIKYEILDNQVIATDETGIGMVYNIIDDNTISYNMLGLGRVTYKRIE